MNERAITILRGQLEARGVEDAADISPDEVLERGIEMALITTEMAEEYRGGDEG